MVISIIYDRTEGLNAKARIAAIVYDEFEVELSNRGEIVRLFEQALETLPDGMAYIRTVRLPTDGAKKCKDFEAGQGD
jgi:hypothetical protein